MNPDCNRKTLFFIIAIFIIAIFIIAIFIIAIFKSLTRNTYVKVVITDLLNLLWKE